MVKKAKLTEIQVTDTTHVKTEVSKEEIPAIHITTEDADVYINGQLIWSKYEDPNMRAIPPVLRAFVSGKNDYVRDEGKQVVVDLWMKNSYVSATLYIPKNLRGKLVARMDFVTSLKDLEDECFRNNTAIDEKTADDLTAEMKALFANMQKACDEAGYKLSISHDSGENYHAWWDVSFPLKLWNEELFIQIWEAFSTFDNRWQELCKQYHF